MVAFGISILPFVVFLGGPAKSAEHNAREVLEMDFRAIETRDLETMLSQVKQGVVDKNILSAIEKHLEKLIKARNGREPAPAKRQAEPNRSTIRAAVEAFLKENVNDPKRLKIARISKPVSTASAYKWMGGTSRSMLDWKPLGVVRKGFWEPIGREGSAVAVRFRATNALGALVLDDKVFCISDGVVFDWMEIEDFRPTRPKRRSDPATDEFMNLLR